MPAPIWDAGLLSTALQSMNQAGDGAFSALMPTVAELFKYVKATAFCLVMGVMLVQRRFLHPDLARMILVFVAVGWLLAVFPTAADKVIQALANAGSIVVPEMKFKLNDPGAIAWFGFKAVAPLMTSAREYLGPVAIFFHFFEFVFYLFAIVMVILAFLVLALHVFFAQIEYLILSVAAWFTIPFAAFAKTSFVATKGIGYVASVGLRILALSMLAAVGTVALLMFETIKVSGLAGAFGLIVLAAGLLVSNVKAPSIAAALINSGPVLDAGMAWNAMRIGAGNGMRSLQRNAGSGGVSGSIVRGMSSIGSAAASVASAGVRMARSWSTGTSSSASSGSNQQAQAGQAGQAGQGNQSTSTQGPYRGGWSRNNQSGTGNP
jgi:type IV secretory pathway TrbL component